MSIAIPRQVCIHYCMSKSVKVMEQGREEMNLAVYPLSVLNHAKNKNTKTIEFNNVIETEDGKRIHQQWIVTGSDKYGLPLPADEEVYSILLAINALQDFPQKQHLTRYGILERLNWSHRASNYKRVEDAIIRIANVSIIAKNCFWDNESKNYVKYVKFGIFDNVSILNENLSKRGKAQASLPLSFVKWNEVILTSARNGYVKTIDLKFRASLDGNLTKRLHQFLDARFYEKHKFIIGAGKLAEYLGLPEESRTFGRIKAKIEPAMQELVNKGYLAKFKYVDSKRDAKEKIIHFYRSHAAMPAPAPEQDNAACISIQSDPARHFYKQLTGHEPASVSEPDRQNAAAFVEEHGADAWRAFVDFAVNHRDEKWPDMKFLGGALKMCKDDFLKGWAARQEQRQQERWQARMEAEAKRLKAEQPEAYSAFQQGMESHPEYRKQADFLKANPFLSEEGANRTKAIMRDLYLKAFADRFGIPSEGQL